MISENNKTIVNFALAVNVTLLSVVLVLAMGYGYYIGDTVGGFLAGCIPASFLACTAALFSIYASTKIVLFVRVIWLFIAVSALFASILFAQRSSPEAIKGSQTLLAYVLLVLAFPLSLLIPFALMLVFSIWEGYSLLGLVAMWLVFVIPGYIQWFVVFPHGWRKLRGRGS